MSEAISGFSGIVNHLAVLEIRDEWKAGVRVHQSGIVRHPETESQVLEVSYRDALAVREVKSMSALRGFLRQPSLVPIMLPPFRHEEDGMNVRTFMPSRKPKTIKKLSTIGGIRADLSSYYPEDHHDRFFLLPCGTTVFVVEGIEEFSQAEEYTTMMHEGGCRDPFVYCERSPQPGRLWWFKIREVSFAPEIPILPLSYLKELERRHEEWRKQEEAAQAERDRLREERASENGDEEDDGVLAAAGGASNGSGGGDGKTQRELSFPA